MTKVIKPCRVCNKPYIPCMVCESDLNAFHWREVACSKECGKEYLRQVLDARSLHPVKVVKDTSKINIKTTESKMKNKMKKTIK